MTAFIVMKIARQYEGEYVWIMPEKAFTSGDKDKAELNAMRYVNNNPIKAMEKFIIPDNKMEVNCLIERGVFEVEIDEI